MVLSSRISTYTQASVSSDLERPKSGDGAKKDMWSSMLDSVASGKRLPEKSILVLGGSSDSQKEFLEALSPESSVKRTQDRHGSRQPPIANNFALGYTYYDVLDADHEDILARLSLYLLSDPSPSFTPLLQPLLTPQTIPNTLIIILLDWSQPWLWLRQLRDWVKLLRTLLVSLDNSCKSKMAEVMVSWRDRGRGTVTLDGIGINTSVEGDVTLPLGPGEWDEALGLPLCVVCQNSDQMEVLERERAWKDEEFDFILQFLRTVLLKHGASLVYTIPSVPSHLQTLIHSSLGIHSLLRKQALKPNVVDRDKVIVPPNWDSWGKIRVLREGFDVEGINKGWSIDIEETKNTPSGEKKINGELRYDQLDANFAGALAIYEETIQDPGNGILSGPNTEVIGQKPDVKSMNPQDFLASQLELLERIRRQDADSTDSHSKNQITNHKTSSSDGEISRNGDFIEEGHISEHIGPVQFNMGGIQVDADDMLQRLKDRQSHQTSDQETAGMSSPPDNRALASFFEGLMKRGGGSAANSTKPGAT